MLYGIAFAAIVLGAIVLILIFLENALRLTWIMILSVIVFIVLILIFLENALRRYCAQYKYRLIIKS